MPWDLRVISNLLKVLDYVLDLNGYKDTRLHKRYEIFSESLLRVSMEIYLKLADSIKELNVVLKTLKYNIWKTLGA